MLNGDHGICVCTRTKVGKSCWGEAGCARETSSNRGLLVGGSTAVDRNPWGRGFNLVGNLLGARCESFGAANMRFRSPEREEFLASPALVVVAAGGARGRG